MTEDDAGAVLGLMQAAWGVADPVAGRLRITHLIETDPGGAWVTVDDDGIVDGGALALVREGLWGLSLLIVREDRQSAGRGRELMGAVTAYGADTGAGIILSSEDPRALRSYWRAGFALRPAFDADGEVRKAPAPDPAVREARWPADRDLVDATSRHVRGAAHGSDIDTMIAQRRRLLVHDDGGFAFVGAPGKVFTVAAQDDRVAGALLRTAIHDQPSATVDFIDALQDWAIDVVLEAGLKVVPAGAICVRGAVGPMRPYIPTGAYL